MEWLVNFKTENQLKVTFFLRLKKEILWHRFSTEMPDLTAFTFQVIILQKGVVD